MRILVTGAAGFIGHHLVEAWRRDGADVVALDDLSTGVEGRLAAASRSVRADVRDAAAVAEALDGVDLVFHMAAAVGASLVARDPVGTWSRNVEGTATVLSACAERGCRVIAMSSSEVYGPEREGRLTEDDPSELRPQGRREVYALSKAAGEALAAALHRSRLLPVTSVRLFNVVGPGQSDRYGMVLPRFVEAAMAGKPLPVYGDGMQRRCFLHVDDAVRALRQIAETPATEGRLLNVGSSEEVRILDLARWVEEETGSTAGRMHVPFERVYGEGFRDPRRRLPDLTALTTLTGFAPRRTARDAVRDLVRVGAAQA